MRKLILALVLLFVLDLEALAEDSPVPSTVLVYMVGSSLESQGMSATSDLMEMMMAQTGNNTQIVVQLGGADCWWLPLNQDSTLAVEPWTQLLQQYQADPVNFALPNIEKWSAMNKNTPLLNSASTVKRYLIRNNQMIFLEDLGAISMSNPNTLQNFIQFGVQNYPAERYDLILWNHGGGTIGGYGFDETQDPITTLNLSQLSQALNQACQLEQIHFDLIGFDACLMGTLETAYALKDCSDYLLASEENISGQGLYYTNWISRLDSNPQISTIDLAQGLITDFLQNSGEVSSISTMALYDLSKIEKVYTALNQLFSVALDYLLNNSQADTDLIMARLLSYGYGDNQTEQIDLLDYTNHLENAIFQEPKDNLLRAVRETIATSGFGYAVYGTCCGMAMYHPYYYLDVYGESLEMLKQIGIGDSYEAYYTTLSNLLLWVQNETFNQPSYLKNVPARQDYSWYDPAFALNYGFSRPDYSKLEFQTNAAGEYVLRLGEEQLVEVAMQLVKELRPGIYQDLGINNQLEMDEEGNLKVAFSGKWLFLNDILVPFYNLSTTAFFSMGYVPCRINNQAEVDGLIVYWFQNDEVAVSNYLDLTTNAQLPLKDGDRIQVVATCYDEDGQAQDQLLVDQPITYNGSNLDFDFRAVPSGHYLVSYLLTDIYQANYWTDSLDFHY